MQIRTFSHGSGGSTGFKAFGHPLAVAAASDLVDEIAKSGRIAVIDPDGLAGDFAALYDLSAWEVEDVFVIDALRIGESTLGTSARALGELPNTRADALWIASFDAEVIEPFRALVPPGLPKFDLAGLRLPDRLLSRPDPYLDPLNFATNFAWFRDADGHHTRLTTAHYWHRYGARGMSLWLCLFDEHGERLAEWTEPLADAPISIVIDSAEVRERFDLPPFLGSLFVHAVGATGHEVWKYALDCYGDGAEVLSSTHDANAWPSDRYAGLPAPRAGEHVILWVQNSHPTPIPAGVVGLREMGGETFARVDEEIPPFATRGVDVGAHLPSLRWPSQVEIDSGRHFVRPRYEVVAAGGRRRIAHANVERADLAPDPEIAARADALGRGFLLPAPLLPLSEWRTYVLPTPMTTTQQALPLRLYVYDAHGAEILQRRLGTLPRGHARCFDVGALLEQSGAGLATGHGHFELAYDVDAGEDMDGWLHALFRYERRDGSHGADTSFGAHLYNLPLVFRDEPQSYRGRPPGLTTRLFLRLDSADRDTRCWLIYPSSGDWHPTSNTELHLHAGTGAVVAVRPLRVPQRGSVAWGVREMFDAESLRAAGRDGYVIVRDTTCRLFGYHGLFGEQGSFSLDHMFGF